MAKEKKIVETTTTEVKEGSKFGWGVLGFFIPLVGLILFLVWKKDKKKAAKAAGIGALVGFLLGLVSTIMMFALGFGTLLGIGVTSEYYENTDTKAKTEEKKKDETKKDETKKEETKKEEKQISGETADENDSCTVKANAGEFYLYTYDYDRSCETVKVIDENNKVLFKINNKKLVLNNGETFDDFDTSFYKIDNSIVVYSSLCSPGYCYVYVYNFIDNTGFKVTSSEEKEDLIAPLITSVGTVYNEKIGITFDFNEGSGLDGMENDNRVKLIGEIKACRIKDIDAALSAYAVDDFPIGKVYTYDIKNGKIENNPTKTVYRTVRYLYSTYTNVCNGR